MQSITAVNEIYRGWNGMMTTTRCCISFFLCIISFIIGDLEIIRPEETPEDKYDGSIIQTKESKFPKIKTTRKDIKFCKSIVYNLLGVFSPYKRLSDYPDLAGIVRNDHNFIYSLKCISYFNKNIA